MLGDPRPLLLPAAPRPFPADEELDPEPLPLELPFGFDGFCQQSRFQWPLLPQMGHGVLGLSWPVVTVPALRCCCPFERPFVRASTSIGAAPPTTVAWARRTFSISDLRVAQSSNFELLRIRC